MYFVTMDSATGELADLTMLPMQIKRFRLNHASPKDALWLQQVVDRESRLLGARVELVDSDRRLALSVRH
jgi:poly-gamma-glutamate capsule biosynthesis protein CapA/YwtB (metallophosphatase superfamily)